MPSRVSLVLPPLLPELYDLIYPSLPVLAATLEAEGHEIAQIDLNRACVDWLLAPAQLERLGVAAKAAVAEAHRRDRLGLERFEGYRSAVLTALATDHLARHGGAAASLKKDGPYDMASFVAPIFDFVRADDDAGSSRQDGLLADFYASQLETVLAGDPDLVGLSIPMGPILEPAMHLAAALKAARPDLPVILGGQCISLLGPTWLEDVLRRSGADALVRFDGEAPILALAARPGELDGVPNLARLVDDRLVLAPLAKPLKLDALALPSYPEERLRELGDAPLSVLMSRGCYWGRCKYCDYIKLYGVDSTRMANPASAVAQMKALHERYGVRNFQLVTEALPATVARRFARALREEALDVSWSTYMRVDTKLDAELAKELGEAGLELLTIGVETFSDRLLDRMAKGHTGQEAVDFIRAFDGSSARVWVNMIPDFPSTTEAEALDSLKTLVTVAPSLQGISVFPFSLTRSSEIGQDPEGYGLRVLEEGRSVSYKEFSVNDLAYEDVEGMDARQKAAMLARYQDIGRQIAAQHQATGSQEAMQRLASGPLTIARDRAALGQVRFRLTLDGAGDDGLAATDKLVVYAAPSGRLVELHPALRPLLERMLAAPAFTPMDVMEMVVATLRYPPQQAGQVAQAVLTQLMNVGLLEPAAAEAALRSPGSP